MDTADLGSKPVFNLQNSWKREKNPFQTEGWGGRDAGVADEMG